MKNLIVSEQMSYNFCSRTVKNIWKKSGITLADLYILLLSNA